MTICNMSIEAGARAGMVAPDQTTFDWVAKTPRGPKGADFDKVVAYWKTLTSDDGARFDVEVQIDAADIRPTLFGSQSTALPDQAMLDREALRGLRIKLTPQGITGASYLEIDFVDPAENVPLPIDWEPEDLYLPSARSTVKQFVSGAQDLMTRLQRIDFEGALTKLGLLMETSEKKISALPLERIGANLDRFSGELARSGIASEAAALLAEARESNRQLHTLVADPALASAPADLAASARRARELLENPELAQSLNRLNQSLGRVDRLLAGRDQEIATLVENLNDISVNLKTLSESVAQHPAGLLFSAPPKPYEPPR